MTTDRDALIWYAYRYSTEMGEAVEAVLKAEGSLTVAQAERLYKRLKRDEGKYLSPDVYLGTACCGQTSERPSLNWSRFFDGFRMTFGNSKDTN